MKHCIDHAKKCNPCQILGDFIHQDPPNWALPGHFATLEERNFNRREHYHIKDS